jgi:hypothetical protein
VYSNLLPGNDSFAVICCNGNMISEPLLSDGRVALVSSHHVTIRIEYYLMGYDEILVNMYETAWRHVAMRTPSSHREQFKPNTELNQLRPENARCKEHETSPVTPCSDDC